MVVSPMSGMKMTETTAAYNLGVGIAADLHALERKRDRAGSPDVGCSLDVGDSEEHASQ
jgi:hypothetical protein